MQYSLLSWCLKLQGFRLSTNKQGLGNTLTARCEISAPRLCDTFYDIQGSRKRRPDRADASFEDVETKQTPGWHSMWDSRSTWQSLALVVFGFVRNGISRHVWNRRITASTHGKRVMALCRAWSAGRSDAEQGIGRLLQWAANAREALVRRVVWIGRAAK